MMIYKMTFFTFLLLTSLLLTSCDTGESVVRSKARIESESKLELESMSESKSKSEPGTPPNPAPPHSYGGWYCPDNIIGFPAVDVQNLDQVPVVADRLPTREETIEGKSLIYIDPTIHPDAKPLSMPLPRLARYYSEFTKTNELVVVIQAVEIGQDSIVGFRFLNGGNGSAWLNEVTFISTAEQEGLGSTPFVAEAVVINAFPKIIWEVITDSTYAKTLGAMFGKNTYLESTWQKDAKVYFKYASDKIITSGIITVIWKNTYIQMDYDFGGNHYVTKILFSKNKKQKNTELHLTAGPYGEDFVTKQLAWHNWLNKVKDLSERKMKLENYFGITD